MRVYNIFNYIITICAVVIISVACSESFLDAPPQSSLDENTLAGPEGVDAALISAYSMLDGWNGDWARFNPPWPTAGSNWIWGSVVSDEAHKGSEPGDQLEIQLLELYQWQPGNEYFNIKFQVLYEGISRSNATLDLLNNVEGISDPEVIEGEARFLRAHFHFDGWKLWENVPYITEETEEFRQPNTSDIIPNIIEDFTFAKNNLPAVQSEVGRATSGAAQAYLGKVLLYTHDYAGAKAELDAVVNSGRYSLQPCFHDIFTSSGENGPEAIFSIQASINDGDGDASNGNFADRLNHPHGGSPFGCCGFHQPSQHLVNAHRVDGDGLPLLDTFNDSDVDFDAEDVDPRLDWTVGRDGVPFLNWGIHDPTWIRARSWAGPYSSKKFIHDMNEQSSVSWSSAQLSSVNIPIIRYSDVLLMLAECEVEVGSLERARELVNMVRTRAADCAIGPNGAAVPIDDASITWASYNVSTYDTEWTDQAMARKAVWFERKIELAMEGHRFFDLRRWDGVGGFNTVDYMNNEYLAVEETKRTYLSTSDGFKPRHMLYPLPTVQIELSKIAGEPQLIQNESY